MSSDATNVYYQIPYSGTPTFVRMYLDTDYNRSTGFGAQEYGLGAEFFMQNGILYRYSGTNGEWKWSEIKRVPYTSSNGVAKVSISRADLGSPSRLAVLTQTTPPAATSAVYTQTLAPTTTSTTSPTTTIAPSPTTTTTTSPTTTTTTSPTTTTTTSPTTTTTISPTTTKTTTTDTSTTTGSMSSVNYTASDASIVNPERGFYSPISCNTPQSPSTFADIRANGNSLVFCYFRLDPYVNSPIAQSTLDAFQTQMDNMRAGGVKTVLRFTYTMADDGVDPALPQLYGHMDQLAPYLSRNKDVIAVIQSGFIGSWGEAANSQHYGKIESMSAQNISDRAAIANKQLQTTPAERFVQIRFPRLKTQFDGSTALTSGEAFNGSAKARRAHHNDSFLATPDDWGTYVNQATEYPYMQAETTYLPMGGETSKLYAPRTDCPNALKELAMFHWSFVNLDFHPDVINSWRNQGCFGQIQQKLGYRLVLTNGSYATSAKPGGTFAVNFTVRNDGWAAPFNGRDVEVVLRNTSTGALVRSKINVDPRRWLAGQSYTVSQNITLPADMANGNYAVLLNLPDPMPALSSRPEYAIQLANTNTWEPSTGFNNLNHTVSVAP